MAGAGLGIGEVETEGGGVAAGGDDLAEEFRGLVIAAGGVGLVGGVEVGIGCVGEEMGGEEQEGEGEEYELRT
jgi:hypothetical protein